MISYDAIAKVIFDKTGVDINKIAPFETDVIGGQAIASAVDFLVNGTSFEINDIDLFQEIRNCIESKDYDYNIFERSSWTKAQAQSFYSSSYITISNRSRCSYVVYKSSRNGLVNHVWVSALNSYCPESSMKTVVDGFDLNCCQAGVNPHTKSIYISDGFKAFLRDRIVMVNQVSTPANTAVRLLKKLRTIPNVTCNTKLALDLCQKASFLLTHDYKLLNGSVPFYEFFGHIKKIRFDGVKEQLKCHFRLEHFHEDLFVASPIGLANNSFKNLELEKTTRTGNFYLTNYRQVEEIGVAEDIVDNPLSSLQRIYIEAHQRESLIPNDCLYIQRIMPEIEFVPNGFTCKDMERFNLSLKSLVKIEIDYIERIRELLLVNGFEETFNLVNTLSESKFKYAYLRVCANDANIDLFKIPKNNSDNNIGWKRLTKGIMFKKLSNDIEKADAILNFGDSDCDYFNPLDRLYLVKGAYKNIVLMRISPYQFDCNFLNGFHIPSNGYFASIARMINYMEISIERSSINCISHINRIGIPKRFAQKSEREATESLRKIKKYQQLEKALFGESYSRIEKQEKTRKNACHSIGIDFEPIIQREHSPKPYEPHPWEQIAQT